MAAGAAAYAVASTRVGHLGAGISSRRLVGLSSAVLAVLMPVFLGWSGSLWVAVPLFCLVGLAAGVRTPSSAALGVAQLEDQATAMMTARTGATQIGYLIGAALGGPVIAAWGYGVLGWLLAVGLAASAGLLCRLGEKTDTLSDPSDRRGGGGASGSARQPQLAVDMGQVALDGAFAQEQTFADVTVRQALRDQA